VVAHAVVYPPYKVRLLSLMSRLGNLRLANRFLLSSIPFFIEALRLRSCAVTAAFETSGLAFCSVVVVV